MRVKLMRPWFARTADKSQVRTKGDDGRKMRAVRGKWFDKGEHDFPESYREFLPSSAIIIGETQEEKPDSEHGVIDPDEASAVEDNVVQPEPGIEEEDLGRAASDQIRKAEEDAEKQRQENEEAKAAKAERQRAFQEKLAAEAKEEVETPPKRSGPPKRRAAAKRK